jgi:hypothetical protein
MPFLLVLALVVVAMTLTALLQKKPKPAGFIDFKFPIPDEGTPQPVIFGDCWTGDWQVLWVGNYRTEAINGGKKL